MAQGKSGRIVIEIEPDLKAKLYIELAKRQMTMKDWFIEKAEQLLKENGQQLLWKSQGKNTQQRKK